MYILHELCMHKLPEYSSYCVHGCLPACLIYHPGGLVCRGILERYSNNVKTFVSLSSPQAGQYGGIIKVDAL